MAPKLYVSIILCTCDRALALGRTMDQLGKLTLPPEWEGEIIVVDNGSIDQTAALVRKVRKANFEVRYLFEERKGKCYALNAGLATARGDYILFTDDDILPSEDWVEQMVEHLQTGRCDAVTGNITLAPDLLRPWMTLMHKMWLALSLNANSRDWSREVIGANMGFRRSVLERVPSFDPELGPGPEALGFCEDTLFGRQLAEAGFKIDYLHEAIVLHQLDVKRLRRKHWLEDSRRRGRTEAYILYHWEHSGLRAPVVQWLWFWMKWRLRLILQPPPALESEGCPPWEMSYVAGMARCSQFCLERRRPRNYSRHGLAKLSQAEKLSKEDAGLHCPDALGRTVL